MGYIRGNRSDLHFEIVELKLVDETRLKLRRRSAVNIDHYRDLLLFTRSFNPKGK